MQKRNGKWIALDAVEIGQPQDPPVVKIRYSRAATGASNNLRASASPKAGVLPSLLLATGLFTLSTGLPATALRSHR